MDSCASTLELCLHQRTPVFLCLWIIDPIISSNPSFLWLYEILPNPGHHHFF